MVPRRRQHVQTGDGRGFAAVLYRQFRAKPPKIGWLAARYRQHTAEEEQVAGLHDLHIRAQRCGNRGKLNVVVMQPLFCASLHGMMRQRIVHRFLLFVVYHLPKCAPPSTCSTSPVMCGASARNTTASTISSVSAMLPIADSVRRKSFGSSLCSGVSTTPGATVFKQMPSLAYSLARFFEMDSMPPLVIIGTEAVTPAIG